MTEPTFGREEGRSLFGAVASSYGEARPDYPAAVWDLLRTRCGVTRSTRILEIGAGSGEATRHLVASGASVVAVEPNEALAAVLMETLGAVGRVDVIRAPFEDADLPQAAFDVVVSATAFHWLEPAHALPKIRSILRPGGWIALWWNVFGDPEAADAFHEATRRLFHGVAMGPSAEVASRPFALDIERRTAELAEHGFEDIAVEVHRWPLVLTAHDARRLYATYSNVIRLPGDERERLLDGIERIAADEFGDRVERAMVTPLYSARRPHDPDRVSR